MSFLLEVHDCAKTLIKIQQYTTQNYLKILGGRCKFVEQDGQQMSDRNADVTAHVPSVMITIRANASQALKFPLSYKGCRILSV